MNKGLKSLALMISLFWGCHVWAGENIRFPEIPGWKLNVNEHVYNAGDLWELINGAADIFLSYYFEDLLIGEYTQKDKMIRVELYRHKTIEDAYGIYTAERMPDYPQVPVGSQGYKSQGVLNFLAGNYYVKIMSAGIEEADEASIVNIAEMVEKAMAQPKSLPELVSVFPDEGKVFLSDTYIAQNFMGYSFFHHAFTARYKEPLPHQLFIIRLPDEEINSMAEQYSALVKESNVNIKDNLVVVNDPFNGTVYLKKGSGFLIGVMNLTDETIARNAIERVYTTLKQIQ